MRFTYRHLLAYRANRDPRVLAGFAASALAGLAIRTTHPIDGRTF